MSGKDKPPQGPVGPIAVVYNVDFGCPDVADEDAEPPSHAADAGVADTALAVAESLGRAGWDPVLLTVTDSVADLPERLAERGLTTVFNLVESLGGDPHREPELPLVLDRLGIRYTGNGARTLALAHAKDAVRERLAAAGVPVPRGFAVADPHRLLNLGWGGLAFPLFVKPARTDASIGVEQSSIVHDVGALHRQLERLASRVPGPYLVEEYLPGREINVAIFPDPRDGLYVPTEIDFSGFEAGCAPIVTYNTKWVPGTPDWAAWSHPCADKLPPSLLREVLAVARTAFLAVGGTSYGRVDMRLDARGRPRVIDINPNNDIHPDAGMCIAAASVGVDHPAFVAELASRARVADPRTQPIEELHAASPRARRRSSRPRVAPVTSRELHNG